MGKKIIVTEKPSVARTFADVLGVTGNHEGYIENNEWIITWCVGHLITLAYPEEYDEKYKRWKEEDLPFLPAQYKYDVIANVAAQFRIIKFLYNRSDIDTIYYAGDPAREGIYIQSLVRDAAGHNENATELVVWIDSQTADEIKKGIRTAKPYSEYSPLIDAGRERAIEDFATGINLSRMLSIKYGADANKSAATKKYRPIAVGRVMTCVLGMIARREREIETFRVTPFYKIENTISGIEAEWKADKGSRMHGSSLLYNENGFKEEKDAKAFIESLPTTVTVEKIEKKIEKKYAPALFNLAELQSECTKRFKIRPDQTLSIAQSLYEEKMITYPRTDARVLSGAIAKEIKNNLSGIAARYPGEPAVIAKNILTTTNPVDIEKTRYTDDSKVTDHYAIIPTGIGCEQAKNLNDLKNAVYDLIVRRFLSIFLQPAEYLSVKITENAAGEKFYATAKSLTQPGYLSVVGIPQNDAELKMSAIDSLHEDKTYTANFSIKRGETAPPKRYTSGSIILAMENAGNLIEDEELRAQIKGSGIGTSATRAEVIKKLINQEYIAINNKTQILTPAPLGNIIYEIVHNTVPDLLSPKMTASWEKGLDAIASGQIKASAYRKIVEEYIIKEIEAIKANTNSESIAAAIDSFKSKNTFESITLSHPCPICNGVLKTSPYGCICSNYKKAATEKELREKTACKFGIGQIAGKALSATDIENLLENGESTEIDGFKSKAGKKFSAKLKLSVMEENGLRKPRLEFVFDTPKESSLICPICRKPLLVSKYGYGCSSRKSKEDQGCGFFLYAEISGYKLTEEDVEELLTSGVLKGKNFISKKNKPFTANIRLLKTDDGYQTKFEFDEPEREASILRCPLCDKNLTKDKWKYSCSCGYSISHIIAKKDIQENDMRNLIETGKTELLNGFISKKGKPFSAYLKLKGTGEIEFDFPPREKHW